MSGIQGFGAGDPVYGTDSIYPRSLRASSVLEVSSDIVFSCWTCGGDFSQYQHCLAKGHDIFGRFIPLDGPNLDMLDHNGDSHMTGSSFGSQEPSYSTGSSFGPISTQDTGVSSQPRTHAWLPDDMGGVAIGLNNEHDLANVDEHSLCLTDTQKETLQRYSQRWARDQHVPTDGEIQALATLENLATRDIRLWLKSHHSSLITPASASIPMSNPNNYDNTLGVHLPVAAVQTANPSGQSHHNDSHISHRYYMPGPAAARKQVNNASTLHHHPGEYFETVAVEGSNPQKDDVAVSPLALEHVPGAGCAMTAPHVTSVLTAGQILREVESYARMKFMHICATAQAARAASDQPYWCTSPECSYTTGQSDAWQRHEQTWQPQEFWLCIICRNISKKMICSRKDKIGNHLVQMHEVVGKDNVELLRDLSKVEGFVAGFETECKFFSNRGRCGYSFRSWQDRTEHYKKHFKDQIKDGPWKLDRARNRWFDGDDDNMGPDGNVSSGNSGNWAGGPAYRTSSGESSSNTGTSTHGELSQSSQQTRSCPVIPSLCEDLEIVRKCDSSPNTKTAKRTIASAECSTSRGSRPCWLIDVNRECLVEPPENAKYLALDHTWAEKIRLTGASVSIVTSPAQDLHHHDIQHLPVPFAKAVAFAKDIGYQFLWIAELCELYSKNNSLRAIFEHAALTVVPVVSNTTQDSIMHLTCHYKNVQQISTWAKKSVSFSHIQNLGHGTYGIVDEVKVLSTQESFARKELLSSHVPAQLRDLCFQEIEIMQKLSHPHIAQFVAAYYQPERRSLNILMSPVAQCDLRQFLSDPSRWADKRDDLSRWYTSLASALSYMHSSDVAVRHKDIKPANILISGHEVLLSDFGASHAFSPNDSGSHGGTVMTPMYCAPEVALKQRRGRKADIFSLGCVFAEMITIELGHSLREMHRFLNLDDKASSRQSTYQSQLSRLAEWLKALKRETRLDRLRRLTSLCRSMITRDPTERPSASEVYRMLSAETGDNSPPSDVDCHCCSGRQAANVMRGISALQARPLQDMLTSLVLPTGSHWGRKTEVGCDRQRTVGSQIMSSRSLGHKVWVLHTASIHFLVVGHSYQAILIETCTCVVLQDVPPVKVRRSKSLIGLAETSVQVSRSRLPQSNANDIHEAQHSLPEECAYPPPIPPRLPSPCSLRKVSSSTSRHSEQAQRLHWRRVFRRALCLLTVVLKTSPSASKLQDHSAFTSLWRPQSIDMRTFACSIGVQFVLMLLWLAAYNMGFNLRKQLFVSAIVDALARVEYVATSDDLELMMAAWSVTESSVDATDEHNVLGTDKATPALAMELGYEPAAHGSVQSEESLLPESSPHTLLL